MSGIAGIIRFDSAPADAGALAAMTDAMRFRGPDGIRHWSAGSVALGHCQLATTAESVHEIQPLANEDSSVVLVCDARLDNWEELRRDLLARGARLRTDSDAELLLRAYECWGEDCARRVEGDFALVVWDARRHTAFCARDYAGMRRFFYHWDGHRLVFATDIHALLACSLVRQELNAARIAECLSLAADAPEQTWWRGIVRLLPAHSMVVDAAGARTRRYWEPDFDARLPCSSADDYVAYYREVLADAVRRQSRSARPLAFDVSGGLDSSALFAMGDRLHGEGRLLAPGLLGFHLRVNDSRAQETEFCRAVAAHLGRQIHEVEPDVPPLESLLEDALRFCDVPEMPSLSMTRSASAAAAASGCRVVIEGFGGDEWAGGCVNHRDAIRSLDARLILDLVESDRRAAGLPRALWRFLRWGVVPALWPQLGFATWRADLHWLTPAARSLVQARRERAGVRHRVGPLGSLAQEQEREWLDRRFEIFELIELARARFGLERRSPYWSRRLVEASIATPHSMRWRGLQKKWVHREATRGLLPEVVRLRTGKANFAEMTGRFEHLARAHVASKVLPRCHAWVDDSLRVALAAPEMPLSYEHRCAMWTLFGIGAVAAGHEFPEPVDIC